MVEKQFDVSPDTATWLEVAANLKPRYDVRLLTGYRVRKVQPHQVQNKIWYYRSSKIPFVNRVTTYLAQNCAFSSVITSFRPSVVLFNTSNPLLLRQAISFKKKCDAKLVFDVRTLPASTGKIRRYLNEKLLRANLRYAASRFDGVTYITQEMRRFCRAAYDLPSHPTAVWTSGVKPEVFRRERFEHNTGPFKILYHGTIVMNRGLDYAIRALALLSDIDVRMEFLGKGQAVPELQRLAKELNVSDRVSFLDAVAYKEVPRWINAGHVGLLPFPHWPAWNTSSPIKLFEYLSCGKPVIVTDIPAHVNVLDGHDFAFWVSDNSPETFARAIRRAFHSRGQFPAMGTAARKLVLEHYTWKKQADNLAHFLASLVPNNAL